MHITRSKFKTSSGKIYESVLLRESYREGGKVKKRTVANLSNCSGEEIEAIELALRYKKDLSKFSPDKLQNATEELTITEGLSFGSVWVTYQMAKRLGIVDVLGSSRNGQLALWQVIARVLEQGSRLSSVRLAETYAIAPVIDLKKGFNEDDLYKNLFWIQKQQAHIEQTLFNRQDNAQTTSLFLYDVTSSYLEGDKNELASWGYNRDKKKGKKQIVVGLLCDAAGKPVSTEVFKGNTQDTTTFANQIQKAQERFGCNKVVFVGDRGMIKSGQISDLQEAGFHYITAISKAQIEKMMKDEIIELSLFDQNLTEIQNNGIRYIIRRNPLRRKELADVRIQKQECIEQLVAKQNVYLKEHPRAQLHTAFTLINKKIDKLLVKKWLSVNSEGRKLSLQVDEQAKEEEAKLDGCYVLKTNLKQREASTEVVHDRYKDLAMVERAFRTEKSDIELRPIYVRSEASTRGHVFIVMLAYMIMRELARAWDQLYLTVTEGLRSLSTMTILEVCLGEKEYHQIPEPRARNKQMLEALDMEVPKILSKNHANVVTRQRRKKSAIMH